MKTYHKIETLYERDMEGTKKLIEGKFRHPLVEYLKDNEWIFTEKVDGTNIRIHWDGHKITYAGRTDGGQIQTNLIHVLNEKFLNEKTEELFEQKFGETPVTLYGEGYGEKIQKGGELYRNGSGFVLFDVMIHDRVFLDRAGVEGIAQTFDIPVVPILLRGTIHEAVDYVKSEPNSALAKSPRIIEGIVGTPLVGALDHQGNRIIVKIKVKDFIS